jgi:hypothetical protein
MKKIVSAAGLAALGAVGLQAAAGDGLSRIEASKPWSIKANLRGFYDDNVFTTPDSFKAYYTGVGPDGKPARAKAFNIIEGPNGELTEVATGNFKDYKGLYDSNGYAYRNMGPVSSYGIEVRPSATLNLVTDQTVISAGYEYGLRWYNDRPGRSSDQSHIANLSINHSIDANTSISLGDKFTLAQEPDVVDSATPLRSVDADALFNSDAGFRNNLDNLNNNLFFSLDRRLNETLSAGLGYQFDIYRYADDSAGGFAARLDRNHHRLDLNLSKQLSDSTSVLLGYQFRNVGFTSSQMLGEESWPEQQLAFDVAELVANAEQNGQDVERIDREVSLPMLDAAGNVVMENGEPVMETKTESFTTKVSLEDGTEIKFYDITNKTYFNDDVKVGELYGVRGIDQYGNPDVDDSSVVVHRKKYYRFDPDSRNTDTHYLFVGVNHLFTPELQASARVGAQFVRYTGVDDANPFNPDDSTVSPYVDANLAYAYAEGSTLSGGIRHERNQTDLALLGAVGSGGQAMDQEATTIYASINHRLTSRIALNATGMYTMSRFDDHVSWLGNDDYLALGLNASYYINQHLSADLGYNFDDLDSAIDQRSFTRNRVYVGLKASY